MPLRSRACTDGDLTFTWSVPAARADVWECLVSSARMAEWLGTPTVFDLRPGGELVVDHGDGYLCRSRITDFREGIQLSLTWNFPDEPETIVTFSLQEPATAGSDLVLEHRRLGSLIDSYRTGWLTHLTFFEASLLGEPIPTSQFWNINSTFDHLGAEHLRPTPGKDLAEERPIVGGAG